MFPTMHSVVIEPVYLGDITARFGHFAPHAQLAHAATAQCEPLCALGDVTDTAHGLACPTLFLWLPRIPAEWLVRVAEADFTVYNWPTADLRQNRMYVSLQSPDLEVRWNAWQVPFPRRGANGRLRVALLSERHAVVALHRFSAEAWEVVEGGMQGCGICSGPNYRPYRIWSDLEMAEAKGHQDSRAPGQMTARRVGVE